MSDNCDAVRVVACRNDDCRVVILHIDGCLVGVQRIVRLDGDGVWVADGGIE